MKSYWGIFSAGAYAPAVSKVLGHMPPLPPPTNASGAGENIYFHARFNAALIRTRTKTSIDSNQEEEKRMRERKGEKVKIERVTFIYT